VEGRFVCRLVWLLAVALPSCHGPDTSQPPAGLARAALDNPGFAWTETSAPGLRVYFLPNSYAWQHRDSLVQATRRAREHDLGLLGADHFAAPIDVFYIESRAQMDSLVGYPVTGFAHRDGRAVFLVTNPTWRAFERHELMHVLAHHIWGPAAEPSAWISEGLAQFADGRCAGYSNHAVARAIVEAQGAIPLDTLVWRFREFDDLSAYLQAASMVGWIYESRGRDVVKEIWMSGLDALTARLGMSPGEITSGWRDWVGRTAARVPAADVAKIQDRGCG
jgi:hypothetical protein